MAGTDYRLGGSGTESSSPLAKRAAPASLRPPSQPKLSCPSCGSSLSRFLGNGAERPAKVSAGDRSPGFGRALSSRPAPSFPTRARRKDTEASPLSEDQRRPEGVFITRWEEAGGRAFPDRGPAVSEWAIDNPFLALAGAVGAVLVFIFLLVRIMGE